MKFTIIILTVLTLLSSCSVLPEQNSSSHATKQPTDYSVVQTDSDEPFRYGKTFLTEEQAKVYDWLVLCAENFDVDSETLLPDEISEDSVNVIADYFWGDNPLHYWVVPYIFTDGEKSVLRIKTPDDMSISQAKQYSGEIEQAADEFLSDISSNAMEAVTQIHDRIVERVQYDQTMSSTNNTNLYGALVDKTAVCDGFTSAFQYLTALAGFDTVFVRGTTPKGIPHSWNMIRIGDEWYAVDTTWDTYFAGNHILREYLNVTSTEMDKEHFWDKSQYPSLPQTIDMTYNYHVYNGLMVTMETITLIPDIFAKQLPNTLSDDKVYFEIKVFGSDNYAYEWTKDYIIENIQYILKEVNKKIKAQEYSINTQTQVEFNFNDTMQIIYVYPEIT